MDSSLNPNNSSWRGRISTVQEYLNDGSALKSCKGYTDIMINEMGTENTEAYCYYNGHSLYILYV